MRVAITGGLGFIGSHTADRLLARGDEVLVIDNLATGRSDNLEEQDRLTIAIESIEDADRTRGLVGEFRPDVVIHAAASYKDPDDWDRDSATNVQGTVNVLAACREASVERLIYFQTSLCYGLSPIEQPVTLKHHIDPSASSYAITKTAGEQFIQLSGIDFVSFRLANAYGPRNLSGPIPTFFQRLEAGKACFVMDTRRDYIYVTDLVDVVEKAVDGTGRGIYHVSSGSDFSIAEVFDCVVRAMAIEPPEDVEHRDRGPDDAFTILLDPSRTEADYQWRTTVGLEEGVSSAVEYYRSRGIEETYTHLKKPAR